MWSEVEPEYKCVDTIDYDKCGEHIDYCPDDENEEKDESSKDTYEYNGADVILVHCIIQLCAIMTICTAFRKEINEFYISLGHIVFHVFTNLYIITITHSENKTNAELSNIGGGFAIIIVTATAKFMRESDDPVSVYLKQTNSALYLAMGVFVCSMCKHPMRIFIWITAMFIFLVHFYDDTGCLETLALRVSSIFVLTFLDNSLECMCFRQFLFVVLTEITFMLTADIDVANDDNFTMPPAQDTQVYMPMDYSD